MLLHSVLGLGLELILAVKDPTITKIFMLLFEKSQQRSSDYQLGEGECLNLSLYHLQRLIPNGLYNSKYER